MVEIKRTIVLFCMISGAHRQPFTRRRGIGGKTLRTCLRSPWGRAAAFAGGDARRGAPWIAQLSTSRPPAKPLPEGLERNRAIERPGCLHGHEPMRRIRSVHSSRLRSNAIPARSQTRSKGGGREMHAPQSGAATCPPNYGPWTGRASRRPCVSHQGTLSIRNRVQNVERGRERVAGMRRRRPGKPSRGLPSPVDTDRHAHAQARRSRSRSVCRGLQSRRPSVASRCSLGERRKPERA